MEFIDFFAGIGGIRLGLERAGHKCVGFYEYGWFNEETYCSDCGRRILWGEENEIR